MAFVRRSSGGLANGVATSPRGLIPSRSRNEEEPSALMVSGAEEASPPRRRWISRSISHAPSSRPIKPLHPRPWPPVCARFSSPESQHLSSSSRTNAQPVPNLEEMGRLQKVTEEEQAHGWSCSARPTHSGDQPLLLPPKKRKSWREAHVIGSRESVQLKQDRDLITMGTRTISSAPGSDSDYKYIEACKKKKMKKESPTNHALVRVRVPGRRAGMEASHQKENIMVGTGFCRMEKRYSGCVKRRWSGMKKKKKDVVSIAKQYNKATPLCAGGISSRSTTMYQACTSTGMHGTTCAEELLVAKEVMVPPDSVTKTPDDMLRLQRVFEIKVSLLKMENQRCIICDRLKELKRLHLSTDMLMVTGIAGAVSRYRKHNHRQIQDSACDLLRNWAEMLDEWVLKSNAARVVEDAFKPCDISEFERSDVAILTSARMKEEDPVKKALDMAKGRLLQQSGRGPREYDRRNLRIKELLRRRQ